MKLEINNYEVVGSRGILIKLEPYKNPTSITDEGILIPLYENYETDGGRPDSRIKENEFSLIGKILQISLKSQEILEREKMDLKIGDYVGISPMHMHQSNWFLVERDTPVSKFTGYLRIDPTMIDSKIINYINE